jgi:hypothetical protein
MLNGSRTMLNGNQTMLNRGGSMRNGSATMLNGNQLSKSWQRSHAASGLAFPSARTAPAGSVVKTLPDAAFVGAG